MSIVKFSDVNLKKISYTKPEKQGQYYYSAITYGSKDPLHIQTSRMICKSEGSECVLKKTPTMELEGLTLDYSFYDFLLSLDERNIQETFRNNESWFGKDIPLEVIDDMYKRTTKPNKENSKPKFIFKIPVVKNSAQCPIYDQKKICQPIDKITNNCEVILILHIRGLKFLKQHYYCDCYVSQMKVFLPSEEKYSVIQDYVIEDDSDSVPLELGESVEKENRESVQKVDQEVDQEADQEAAQEKAAQEKVAQEKAAQEKVAQEKVAQEKVAQEKVVQEKAAQEKTAQEKVAEEKAAQEKAAQEKAAQEKAAQEKEQLEKKKLLQKEFEEKQKFLETQVLEMEKIKRELDNL
jgi:hypothetical protein